MRLARLWCWVSKLWFAGHDWRWVVEDRTRVNHVGLYSLAGLCGYCRRCGLEHVDGCAEAVALYRRTLRFEGRSCDA